MQTQAVTAETLDAVRAALASPSLVAGLPDVIAKATTQGFTQATGLVGINLEAPSKKLFPVLSPLRNRWARKASAAGATAVQWRAITKINSANLKAGVAEGVRNGVVTTVEVDKSQTYKTFGLDDSVTMEATWAGRGFEDVRATSSANLLSATMVEEEKILLGGNVTALGSPGTIVFDDLGTGGSLSVGTQYDVAVSGLTLYGWLNGATGRGSADSIDETTAVTGTHTTTGSGAGSTALDLSWPALRGAVAYNVYAGAHSGTKFYVGTVTTNFARVLAIPGSGNVPNTSDQTADALSFDGLIAQGEVSGNGAYFKDLANATLTGDNAGGIVEWDAALKSLYDTNRIGPSAVLVNSQQAGDGLKKVAANGSSTTMRLNASIGADGSVSGGLMLADYLNKYTQQRFPVITHPYLAPGTQIFISERLPFPNNNVPNVFEVDVRSEYTQYDWALTQRKYEFGVYGSEALKCYFPGGIAVITGTAPG